MMNSGVWNSDRRSGRITMGLAFLLVVFATGALAWEQPKEWPEIGAVSKWKEYDARFYRIYEAAPFVDQSQFKMDQVKQYAKTWEYNGQMDGIGLAVFLTKDADEQKKRRKQAAKHLKFVADFHIRMQTMVQRTKQGTGSGWGIQVNDMTVVGDCLGKLRTAVLLDASNPYAWHVLAYFSNTVGDQARAATALANAEGALAQIPKDQLTELRAEVALDRAWLQHDQGYWDDAIKSLQAAVEFGAKGTEPRLIQGLVAAQSGQTQKAVEIANTLRSAEVRAFPPNLTSTSFAPDLSDVTAWRARTSNYLQSWILALTWLNEGKTDMAAAAFGQYSLDDLYPYAERFWNDAGRIYEITGRRSLAHKAWSMARINTPYVVYFVFKPYAVDVGKLTGRPGAIPFFLGFDQFYTSGSRLAFGAAMVEQVAAATDEIQKQELAARTLDELEVSLATNMYPGQSQVLKGQTYYLMGDLGSALVEVEEAMQLMDDQGDKAGLAAVLQGLSESDSDLSPTDVANFFSQSGSMSGRWMTPEDREAKLAGMRKSYEENPTDSNRHELARFLIRNDKVEEGRDLAMGELKGQELGKNNILQLSGDDLALVLEADRAEGEDELALALVKALEGGADDPWDHAHLWIMVGFICIDGGDLADGKVALERALELDPGNQGLKIQLAIMDGDTGDKQAVEK
jgi:tetratricopeptide (TPR) repeat protein